jgi:hypothetical protein
MAAYLKAMAELADYKEKYYRLGAEMSQIKKHDQTYRAKFCDENQHLRMLLQEANDREDRLRSEFAAFREDAQTNEVATENRIDGLQSALEVRIYM